MKTKILCILCLLAMPCLLAAQGFVNLTPKPRQMTVGTGELTLPRQFVVSTTGLNEEMAAEAAKFVADFNKATGYEASAQAGAEDALIRVAEDASLAMEAYRVNITADGVQVEAATSTGLFFAFQTLKKLLPANVMAGVRDEAVTRYALPAVAIDDAPRFGYRGFMLDVARHFFTVEEVKRMLDVMSYYKMNRFHWHLSDDQGWRVEIKKWPKLTTVGATAPNCYVTDLEHGAYYTNKPYGPYSYTHEEIREVVAYAKERHIEIIPEIDMPGHFVAAMAAYPEFSCDPANPPTVWYTGGISSNVLNVANPAAVQFAKDILEEIIGLFPYEMIHIGGDECPTSAWESNALCQAMYQELGLTNYRQLQSHFIKEMSDFVQSKGRRIAVWNEAITAGSADTELIRETGATVFCWQPAAAGAKQAAQLGLDNIYTPWGPYYINRKQSTDACEATLPGNGSDNVQATYNEVPVPTSGLTEEQIAHYTGVQGTFWTEHIADRKFMEYQALPRLIAVAEAGWTQQADKNFADFQKRITADTLLLNYNGYYYGRHFILDGETNDKVMPNTSTDSKKYYYRIVTRATDAARTGRCFELLREGSPLISTYSANGAAAGRIWTNEQAAEGDEAYDYQFWFFEEDATQPGRYALCCKAQPEGSVNPAATAQSNAGRWTYDATAKHYDFVLGDQYGEADGYHYYTIRSANYDNWYMNASMTGQGLAVNLWTDPASGNGGLWSLRPLEAGAGAATVAESLNEAKALLAVAKTYADAAEKRPGLFGAAEKAALEACVKDADPESMSEAELAEFTTAFEAAYTAFTGSFGYLENGKTYRIANAVEGFEGTALADGGEGTSLRHATGTWAGDAWEVSENVTGEGLTQTVCLKNVATGRSISTVAASATGRIGFPVSVGTTAGTVTVAFNPAEGDFTLSLGGKNLFPVPVGSTDNPGTVSAGSTTGGTNAIRPMGAAWGVQEVRVVTYDCRDEAGNALGIYVRSADIDEEDVTAICPEIKHHTLVGTTVTGSTVEATYRRSAYAVKTVGRDQRGAYICEEETACPVGESLTVSLPAPAYYTLVSSTVADGTVLTPTADLTIEADYTTTAYNGVKRLAAPATEVKDGHSYVIYDSSTANNGARKGYRAAIASSKQVNRTTTIEGATPLATWLLEADGAGFRVGCEALGLYMPLLSNSTVPVLGATGGVFTFTQNADESWKIKGSNGTCWDGNENGNLVGWNDPGHPYLIYEYFADPYFRVTVKAVNTNNEALGESSALVKAGEAYTLTAASYANYVLKEIQGGGEALESVGEHLTVTLVYEPDPATGIGRIEADGTQAGIYDLQGRRVARIAHGGIYIVDGQKVMVK